VRAGGARRTSAQAPPHGRGAAPAGPSQVDLAHGKLDLVEVAAAHLWRLDPADHALRAQVPVLDDDLDRLMRSAARRAAAPRRRTTAAQLVTQDRVHALGEDCAHGAATALAGGGADAHIVVDGEAHAPGDETAITVRPCPPVALLEDHATESFCQLPAHNPPTIR
jgi:hypothetical protein